MGVAFGKFIPAAGYASIQAQVVGSAASSSGDLLLTIRREEEELKAHYGVHITDYSADLGPDGLEVEAVGIVSPPYESLFPEHVATPARALPKNG
ncbi:MAG: hypothetical protein SynsKO_07180 [Synoicihabitans sp.]